MMYCVEIVLFVNDCEETGRGKSGKWATAYLDVLDETGVSCDVSVRYFVVSARPYYDLLYGFCGLE
jgi:hypothetical protein